LLLTVGNITLGSKKGIAQNKDGTFLFAFLFSIVIIAQKQAFVNPSLPLLQSPKSGQKACPIEEVGNKQSSIRT